MSEQDEYKQMIYEIRSLLTPNHFTPQIQQQANLSDVKIKQYLTESYSIVEKGQFQKNQDPHLIYNKIGEASALLSHQSDMIKNYVKNKIQAQVFSSRKPEGMNQKQYEKLIEERERLERKRLEQKVQESKRVNNMIQSVRKYKNYENKAEVPLAQLQSLVNKERTLVDNLVKEELKIKSENNRLLENTKIKYEPFGQKIQNKSKSIRKQEQAIYQIQVTGVDEDENTFLEKKASSYDNKIAQILTSKKNFLKIFSAFLNDQLRKMHIGASTSPQEQQNLQNTQKQKKKFRFSNQLANDNFQQAPLIGITQLSKMYKFKPFVEVKEEEYEQRIKNELVKKVISKRIGASNKYHMKQCVIKDNIFYYTDQQNSEGEVKLKDMKSIQIGLNMIEQKNEVKEEGSFFQNKQTQTEVAILKGVNRDFVFQLQIGEGTQLKQQICKVNLRRIHKMNCILTGHNNEDMGKFIESEHQVLNLSEGYLRPKQQYPQQEMRQNFIKLLVGLFGSRKKVSKLNFSKCKLSLDELKSIIIQGEKHFLCIQSLNFSNTKLDEQTLKLILNMVIKCSTSDVCLNLDFCGLDDKVIQANLPALSDVCSKAKVLELAGNQLTSKSVRGLKNILASKVCSLKVLNISTCLIEDFGELVGLVKQANKLQIIKANECRFVLNNQKQMQDLLSSTSQKQQLKQLELKRIICTGAMRWFQQIGPYLQIHVDLPSKFAHKSLQSKYLKVSLINNK